MRRAYGIRANEINCVRVLRISITHNPCFEKIQMIRNTAANFYTHELHIHWTLSTKNLCAVDPSFATLATRSKSEPNRRTSLRVLRVRFVSRAEISAPSIVQMPIQGSVSILRIAYPRSKPRLPFVRPRFCTRSVPTMLPMRLSSSAAAALLFLRLLPGNLAFLQFCFFVVALSAISLFFGHFDGRIRRVRTRLKTRRRFCPVPFYRWKTLVRPMP
mmetsp:Transcript_7970/g.19239  ORF Transcript_7970/g.19239 Transcript_7970/m.19239 type:complete len:216 (+) Transcript_7970:2324-2971(+)